MLKMLEAYLSRLGHSVTSVNTTEKAWVEIEKAPEAYTVAVVDASMPGIRMYDLALRMLEANHEMRVLVASGYPVDMSPLEAAAPGRVAFLHKPFTPEMLAVAVRSLLGTKKTDI